MGREPGAQREADAGRADAVFHGMGGWRVWGGGGDEDAEFGVGVDQSVSVSGGGGKGGGEEVDEGSFFVVGTRREGRSGDLGGWSEGSWGKGGRDSDCSAGSEYSRMTEYIVQYSSDMVGSDCCET